MRKLILVFFVFLLSVSIAYGAVNIELNKNSLKVGDQLKVTIISTKDAYSNKVYFYDKLNNPKYTYNLKCGEKGICYKSNSFDYVIPEDWSGDYYVLVYDYGMHNYLKKGFEVNAINKEYVDTTNDMAIIILSTNTIQEMQIARKIVEEKGVRIYNIFPPSVFIGRLPKYITSEIKKLDVIEEISYGKVDTENFTYYELSASDAINLWNRNLDSGVEPMIGYFEEEDFIDKVVIPVDLPKNEEERLQIEKNYQEKWEIKRQEFLIDEEKRREEWIKKRGKVPVVTSGASVLDSQGLVESVVTPPRFGKAYGAGYYDTSLYMAGDVAVGVFFTNGSKGYWTPNEINANLTRITNLLNYFIEKEPNANIVFTIIPELTATGDPKSAPNSESDRRDHVNNLRNLYNTHWAFMILVEKGEGWTESSMYGPVIWLGSDDIEKVHPLLHETMHMFGASDQYVTSMDGPISRSGYLNVVNANSKLNDSMGFFGGSGEGKKDIMIRDKKKIGVYSRGQIGWRDSNGNGILDPLDTFPNTDILDSDGLYQVTYTGRVYDVPLLSETPANDIYKNRTFDPFQIFKNVSINYIKNVEYRINGGPWISAEPQDHTFDSGEERFVFTTPPLKNGKYLIETRAINSVGNIEVSYAKDELIITESPINNVGPFTSFLINPPEGSIVTDFTFDASTSSDIEDNESALEFRWNFGDGQTTGWSNNKVVNHRYSTHGKLYPMLDVKDSSGQISSILKSLDVTNYDRPPNVYFTITPENFHGSGLSQVKLDASDSYDSEDEIGELHFRWNFRAGENDSVNFGWDTDWLDNPIFYLNYSIPADYLLYRVYLPRGANDVFVKGRYAYVAAEIAGLQIIDLTNGSIVGSWVIEPHISSNVYVYDDYAYVWNYRGDFEGTRIINISDPRNPTLINNLQNVGIDIILGNYAYSGGWGRELHILNIEDPENPIAITNWTDPESNTYKIGKPVIFNNYVYLISRNTGTINKSYLRIINITNPEAPTLVGSFGSEYLFDNRLGVSEKYPYIYIIDKDDTQDIVKIKTIDISNPKNPNLKDQWVYGADPSFSHLNGEPVTLYVSGDFLYIPSESPERLEIVDISKANVVDWIFQLNISERPLLSSIHSDGNYLAIGAGLHSLVIFTPKSKHWKVRLGVKDTMGNISTTTRDLWGVAYNHPPSLDSIRFFKEGDKWKISAVGGSDPDGYTTWDGLLEYRWDFDNDKNWGTRFSEDVVDIPTDFSGSKIGLEAKDRFHAIDKKEFYVHKFLSGWNMISLPVEPQNADPRAIFEGITIYGRLFGYDAIGLGYTVYPHSLINLTTGQGYWLYMDDAAYISFEGYPAVSNVIDLSFPPDRDYQWFLIGSPSLNYVDIDDMLIRDKNTGLTLDLVNATYNGWISLPMFGWDPEVLSYFTVGSKNYRQPSQKTYFEPWRGYWIYVEESGKELVLP